MIDLAENSFQSPLYIKLDTKQGQVDHIKIINRFAFEGVYYQFLNIISTYLKMVTIHGRGKI